MNMPKPRVQGTQPGNSAMRLDISSSSTSTRKIASMAGQRGSRRYCRAGGVAEVSLGAVVEGLISVGGMGGRPRGRHSSPLDRPAWQPGEAAINWTFVL